MDGLQSFTYLVDNLPQWIEKLDLLSHQVAERHAEFEALAKSQGLGPPSIRKEKTGSTESLRPRDDTDVIAEPPSTTQATLNANSPSTPPVRVDINPDSKRLFQEYRQQAKRKRTSASLLSAASGTQKFRSRNSLIVFYVSQIQDEFEWLVRSISSARNNLRKGKTSASFKARLASMGMEESPFIGDRTDVSLRNPNLARLPRTQGKFMMGGQSLESFDLLDKELEAAQTLCEVGAHQFLRDGICADELSGTRERFDLCLQMAKEQKRVYEAMEKEKTRMDNQKFESPTSSDDSGVQVDSDFVTVDPTYTPISSIAVDPIVAGADPETAADIKVAVDPEFSDPSDVAVDPIVAVDPAVAVDPTNSIAIDSKDGDIKVDSKLVHPDLAIGDNKIEVDNDPGEFKIDLEAFRRTRRR